MEFRRLRLAGFKSFVEPAELRIEPGLTGVVGPNGCGKSNLLEALRWVMGEASPKSMRSGGMDDVIFAGTGARPARSFAQVTLAMAGAAGEEIEVSRRIERGTGSDYRLNGRETRAQDVRLLFADSATGAHSPAIVGQGRISAIIAAKPAERRMLLEEAAGIAGLHVRRREAEIRLRAAEANVLRLDDVIQAADAQANALRRQARVAERYRALTDRLKIAEAHLLYARWQAAQAASQAARTAAVDAEARTGDLARIAAGLTSAATNAAADLPALRLAEAEAAAAEQALRQYRALLDAEAEAARRRDAALVTLVASIARDAAREAGLAEDAIAATARLDAETAALTASRSAALAALPVARAAVDVAEAAAKTAEVALAGALDTHASAAAGARAAAAAADAAAARLARAQAEARDLSARAARMPPLPDTASLAAAVDAASLAADIAGAALAAAEAARPAAEGRRSEAAATHAAVRATLAGLGAEADAIARRLAADAGRTARIADILTATAGHEAALAAALGDDLDAGPANSDTARRWAGLPDGAGAGDPALPAGAVPLAASVAAPPELARRLAQIGVVIEPPSPAMLAALAPGQRLVTPGGALWRWDGFVDAGGRSDAAAARLRARRRAAELETERAAAAAALAAAAATLADAVAGAGAAHAADARARAARDQAARTLADARARLAAAQTVAGARAGEAASLVAATERNSAECARLVEEAATARAAVPAADTLQALAQTLAAARTTAESTRAAVAAARAAADAPAREAEAAARRLSTIAAECSEWQRRNDASAGQQAELARRAEAASAERGTLASRGDEVARDIAGIAARAAAARAATAAAADARAAAEAGLAALTAQARAADEAVAAAREARATARAEAEHQDGARADVERLAGDRFGCPPPVLPGRFGFSHLAADPDALAMAHDDLAQDRERLGPVNLRADIELAELETQAKLTAAEKAELDTAIARLRGSIGSLNREGRARLSAAFTAVDAHFRQLFTDLFGGGEARLELIESDDPLEAGLEIMAQPPGKKLQSLTLLSGGEQALTAAALIFGLFLANPAPICVLDEVDAPLDDANVERFCDLLDRMAADTATRFLIVTHNAVTMSRMHRLYGVTMGEPGVSQLVSVDLQAAERLLAAE